MKCRYCFLFAVILSMGFVHPTVRHNQPERDSPDSLYVYSTQTDLLDNRPNISTSFEIKTGSLGLYSKLWGVASSQDMKVHIREDSAVVFIVGEIFAFRNKGQLYVYVPKMKRYMTLVFRSPRVLIYFDHGAGLELRFAKDFSETPKNMSRKDLIRREFKDDSVVCRRLLEVYKKVDLAPWFQNEEYIYHESKTLIRDIMEGSSVCGM